MSNYFFIILNMQKDKKILGFQQEQPCKITITLTEVHHNKRQIFVTEGMYTKTYYEVRVNRKIKFTSASIYQARKAFAQMVQNYAMQITIIEREFNFG